MNIAIPHYCSQRYTSQINTYALGRKRMQVKKKWQMFTTFYIEHRLESLSGHRQITAASGHAHSHFSTVKLPYYSITSLESKGKGIMDFRKRRRQVSCSIFQKACLTCRTKTIGGNRFTQFQSQLLSDIKGEVRQQQTYKWNFDIFQKYYLMVRIRIKKIQKFIY